MIACETPKLHDILEVGCMASKGMKNSDQMSFNIDRKNVL